MERELKLLVSAGKAEQVLHSAALARYFADSARTEDLISTYFDTPDLAFRRCGASLRVRADGDRRLQTLKLDGSVTAGFYERDEFECPVNGNAPNLISLQDLIAKNTDCGKLVREEGLSARLKPIFVTRVKRSTVLMRLPDGEEAELAVDDGVIEAESGSMPIHGIEMELKSGTPNHLYELALDLLDDLPLRIDYLSKGDRGYELLVQEHSRPVRAQPLKLSKRDTVEDSFGRVTQNCLAQVHGNERGVVSGHDPSSVHQMRVGLRRLRSALTLFGDRITAPTGLQEELKWIAGELGDARDWEVLAGSTLENAFDSVSDDTDALAVRQAAQETAAQNRKRAASAVDSVRYTRLVLELTRWVDTSRWRDELGDEARQALGKPVRKFASKTLYRRHKQLIKRGRGLAELDDESRHRARIAAKKLRYATEFFGSLYSNRSVRNYIGALSRLQDDLGWRNDMVVADGLLKSLPVTRPETAAGAGFARGYLASRVAADHDALKTLWKHFNRLAPPQ